MKYFLCIFLSVLWANSFSQSIKCEDVKNDHYAYLISNYIDLIDSIKLLELGKCFVMSEEFNTVKSIFTIPQRFIDDHPDLILLINGSETIETDEEKQSWYDTLLHMNDEQINKFYNLLVKEVRNIGNDPTLKEKKKIKKKKKIREEKIDELEIDFY